MTDDLDDMDLDDEFEAELAASESELDDGFRTSLALLLSAPEGLATRTTEGVGDTLLNRSTLAAAVDLVTVGWHTIRLLGGDSPAQTQEDPR
jgi:hypothetical protein